MIVPSNHVTIGAYSLEHKEHLYCFFLHPIDRLDDRYEYRYCTRVVDTMEGTAASARARVKTAEPRSTFAWILIRAASTQGSTSFPTAPTAGSLGLGMVIAIPTTYLTTTTRCFV